MASTDVNNVLPFDHANHTAPNQSGPSPGPPPRMPYEQPPPQTRYPTNNNNRTYLPAEPGQRMQSVQAEDRPFTYGQPLKGPVYPTAATSSAPVDNEYLYLGTEQAQQPGEVDPRYRGAHIPSKSFRILQEMTGGPEEQDQQLPQLQGRRVIAGGVPMFGPPGSELMATGPTVPASQQPAEAEPKKYMGGHIPSRSFRILQAMTGPDDVQQTEEETTPSYQEDTEHAAIEPRMYMGGHIPSRSFRILQAMTGDGSAANGEHGVTDF